MLTTNLFFFLPEVGNPHFQCSLCSIPAGPPISLTSHHRKKQIRPGIPSFTSQTSNV